MKFDVIGRINNMRLPDGKTAILYSVYEAVSNSIHAINDRFGDSHAASKGVVDVDIATDESGDIASISITDNGMFASDKPINTFTDSPSKKEPDLIFFNPLGFRREGTNDPVTIVEFKRPGDEKPSQQPISQVLGYIDELRGSKVRDVEGAVISDIGTQTPFECFIVCELTESTRKMFTQSLAQHPTPDGEGYYGWSSQHNARIRVISFKKMLRDAEQRNQAFFSELDLGSPSLAAKKRSARKREEGRSKKPQPIQATPDGR